MIEPTDPQAPLEPLDDELREFVAAYKQIEHPSAAARTATWTGVDARLSAELTRPPRRRQATATIMAMAAALVLCIGLAAAAAWRARPETTLEASPHHSVVPAPIMVEMPTPQHPAPPQPEPTPRSEPTEAVQDVAVSAAKPARRRRPQAATPSLRPEEVASFQRAQAALAEDHDEAALRALDEHGRRFPGGFFEEERLVSRAAALCKLGRVVEARTARDRFLRARPASHLTERMRQTCPEIE